MTGLNSYRGRDHHRGHDAGWNGSDWRGADTAGRAPWHPAYDAFAVPLDPGEPITPRRRRRHGSTMLEGLIAVVVLCGIGWLAFETHATWRPWVGPVANIARSGLDRAIAALTTPSPAQEPAPLAAERPQIQPPAPLVTAAVDDTPGVGAGTPVAPGDPDAEAVPAAASGPLPPPRADPADPLQVRALAAGLHPGLSRVLLAALTAEDYRNARTAVTRAIANVPAGGSLVWPQQRSPGRALFKVRFVAGAPPQCRRYVVTVTKDRWSTTALPMESCGGRLPGEAPPPVPLTRAR